MTNPGTKKFNVCSFTFYLKISAKTLDDSFQSNLMNTLVGTHSGSDLAPVAGDPALQNSPSAVVSSLLNKASRFGEITLRSRKGFVEKVLSELEFQKQMKSSSKTERTFQAENREHKTAGNVLVMVSVIRVGESISQGERQGQPMKIMLLKDVRCLLDIPLESLIFPM